MPCRSQSHSLLSRERVIISDEQHWCRGSYARGKAGISVAVKVPRRVSERHEIRAKMEELAKDSGFSVAELFGGRRGRGGKVAPKYRNPKDPSQTWTGRGRRPRWIVEAGGDVKRFLIAS